MDALGASSTIRRWLLAGSIAIIVAAGVVLLVDILRAEPYIFYGLLYDRAETAPDFVLTDQNNQPFQMRNNQGRVVVFAFGFTHCPEVCPTTLAIWNRVYTLLEDDADRVRFVFITVDPERDTPEQLGKHLSFVNTEFIGLTGSLDEIEDVARAYNVYFEKVKLAASDDYLVNHTALTFVVDDAGRLVLAFEYATRAEEIVADLEVVLK